MLNCRQSEYGLYKTMLGTSSNDSFTVMISSSKAVSGHSKWDWIYGELEREQSEIHYIKVKWFALSR